MEDFTFDELNLMAIYNTGTRQGLIHELAAMRGYLDPDETELMALTDSTLDKLGKMSDGDYATLELYPDFDMEE